MPDKESQMIEDAKRMIDYMNTLISLDPDAITLLAETRVPCNDSLADHPSVQVLEDGGSTTVGLLGILNGFLGAYEKDGWGPLAAHYSKGKIVKFSLYDPAPAAYADPAFKDIYCEIT